MAHDRRVRRWRGFVGGGVLVILLAATVAAVALAPAPGAAGPGTTGPQAQAQPRPYTGGTHLPLIPWKGQRRTVAEAKNIKQLGWTDMNGRPDGEQLIGQVINGRDYIFQGHNWSLGISVVDVTDPTKPHEVAYIPPTKEDYPAKYSKLYVVGTTLMAAIRPIAESSEGQRPKLNRHGVVFFDVSDPVHPKFLSYFKTANVDAKLRGTDGVHYSWWSDRYAYISTPMDGYAGHIFMILDPSDPRNVKEVGRWWYPGQHVEAGEKAAPGFERYSVHGAQANRDETLGFASSLGDPPGGFIILDIKDKTKPKVLSRVDMSPPMVDGYFGVHNVALMESRKILVCMNEGVGNSLKRPQMTGWVVDYADPTKPVILSILPIPEGHDRTLPARFGPHNAHENHPNGLVDDYTFYVSWFNEGARLFDLTDPRHPTPIGFFRPPDPKYRVDMRTWNGEPGDPDGSELASLNRVYVDKRGYIYTSGYQDGMYVLEYTGPRSEGSRKALEQGQRDHAALVAKTSGR